MKLILLAALLASSALAQREDDPAIVSATLRVIERRPEYPIDATDPRMDGQPFFWFNPDLDGATVLYESIIDVGETLNRNGNEIPVKDGDLVEFNYHLGPTSGPVDWRVTGVVSIHDWPGWMFSRDSIETEFRFAFLYRDGTERKGFQIYYIVTNSAERNELPYTYDDEAGSNFVNTVMVDPIPTPEPTPFLMLLASFVGFANYRFRP